MGEADASGGGIRSRQDRISLAAGVEASGGASPAPAASPQAAPAWEELGDGRWLPYRIRGSWRGVLG